MLSRPCRAVLVFRVVKRYLHREIQTSSDGHDSSEDAIAALDLINLKLREGPNFGVNQSSGETIFEVMARSRKPCTMVADPKIIRRVSMHVVLALNCIGAFINRLS